MAGATAATAAGVSASQAGTITINLLNNYISATGGNHLNADLTGDGQADLIIANAFYSVYYHGLPFPSFNNYIVRVDLNGVHAQAFKSNDYGFGTVRLGSQIRFFGPVSCTSCPQYGSLMGSIPISFKDLHINNGKLTSGSLEVTLSSIYGHAEIQLDSFTYKTSDEGSSLALLAMGAGGILALRRWRAAQGRS